MSAPGTNSQNRSYDHVENVNDIIDTLFTESRSFGYDDLNRLASASGNDLLAAKQSPVTNPEKKLFYHNDHLGGVNVISDITGNRIQLTEYEPWGKVSRTDPATNSPDPEKRFTGQILDPESGLYYYGARYYDPDLARFISPDPIVPSPGDPQSLNRYTYVRNNPVKYIDPTGHSFWSAIGNLFSGFFKSIAGKIAGFAIAQWLGGPLGQILGSIASRIVNSAMSGGGFGLNSFTGGFTDGIMSAATGGGGGGGGDGGGMAEESGSIGEVPGYTETGKTSWRADNDQIFTNAANNYNRAYGLQPEDQGYRTPQFVKAWAMIESGGNKEAFLSDPLQVNVPGDWDAAKLRIAGLTGPNQTMTPEISAAAGLEWLRYKSFLRDGQGGVTYLGDWGGLQRYNGSPAIHDAASRMWGLDYHPGMIHKDWYASIILRFERQMLQQPNFNIDYYYK
jgi:RHS repeat-associated protein